MSKDMMKAEIEQFHGVLDAAFDDVADGVEDELKGIREQITQIESLLKDAIASLYEGFEGISEESNAQMQLMTKLMNQSVSAHDDTPNIFQRTEAASVLLKRLVDMLIDGSRVSLKTLTDMEGMHARIKKTQHSEKKMHEMTQELETLLQSDAPDVLALRALSARMCVQSEESQTQMDEVAEHVSRSYGMVKHQASRDLDDVYCAKEQVEDLLAQFYAISDYLSSCRADIGACNAQMRHHLGVAIRALQFEDITTQSLGHTRLHLDRMEGFVLRMTQGISNIDPAVSDGVSGYAEKIHQIHEDMLQYREELALTEKNPVSQQNLDEGDVDLF